MLNIPFEHSQGETFNEEQNVKQLKTLWELERKMNKQERILPQDGNNFVALIDKKNIPYYSLDRKQISLERYRLNEMSKHANNNRFT